MTIFHFRICSSLWRRRALRYIFILSFLAFAIFGHDLASQLRVLCYQNWNWYNILWVSWKERFLFALGNHFPNNTMLSVRFTLPEGWIIGSSCRWALSMVHVMGSRMAPVVVFGERVLEFLQEVLTSCWIMRTGAGHRTKGTQKLPNSPLFSLLLHHKQTQPPWP